MPIYEFQCPACGNRFERLAGAGTESAECPQCGAKDASRVLSAPAPAHRLVKSPGTTRRMEDKRGVSRDGAKQRFKEQRAREKRAGGRGG
jgi:putative FmdB family regulatory protein